MNVARGFDHSVRAFAVGQIENVARQCFTGQQGLRAERRCDFQPRLNDVSRHDTRAALQRHFDNRQPNRPAAERQYKIARRDFATPTSLHGHRDRLGERGHCVIKSCGNFVNMRCGRDQIFGVPARAIDAENGQPDAAIRFADAARIAVPATQKRLDDALAGRETVVGLYNSLISFKSLKIALSP